VKAHADQTRPVQPPSEPDYGQVPLLYAAAWVAMTVAVMAQATLFTEQRFTVKLAVLLSLALPTSLTLRARKAPRPAVNFVVFSTALILGLAELRQEIALAQPPMTGLRGLMVGVSDAQAMATLIRVFCWIMVFRAFALLEDRDVVLSAVPAMSVLLLVIVLNRSPALMIHAFVITSAVVFLLAFDHGRSAIAARSLGTAGARFRLHLVNTWATAQVWVWLVAAMIFAGVVAADMPQRAVRRVRIMAAYEISRLLLSANRFVYAAPSSVVDLEAPSRPLGKTVMLRVAAPEPALWRAEVYSVYAGRTWRKGNSERRKIPLVRRVTWFSENGANRRQQANLLAQEFTAVQPICGILYAAYRPVAMETQALHRVDVDDADTMTCSRVLHAGQQYAVISERPPRPDPDAQYDSSDPLAELRAAGYLDVACVPPPVAQLARVVTRQARSPYERARDIEAFLESSYQYTPRTPPLPPGEDFVEHFLFDLRRGNCNHFASAMAVMCRCVGVPTRLATGFASDHPDEVYGAYLLKESDAHAWVEAYLPGAGWVEFDPTPAREKRSLARTVGLWRKRAGQALAAVLSKARGSLGALAHTSREHRAAAATVGAVVVVALLSASWWRTRGRPQRRRLGASDNAGAIITDAYDKLCRAAARLGRPKSLAATPYEFGDDLAAWAPDGAAAIRSVVGLFVGVTFGDKPPDADQSELATEACRAAIRAMRRRPAARAGDDHV
jgi:transglutaminase-like putative cysteine protease